MIKKIISYNVNGLRAASEKGFVNWLRQESPDIICIQETKLQPEQMDISIFEKLGYYSYFHSAEKKGYSGVALLSRFKPLATKLGMGVNRYDVEGRILMADFENFTQVCVYIPSGTTGEERQQFKMKFINDFASYILNIMKEKSNLIISGDFNICHKPIDINHPEKHQKSSGFLPEERNWLDGFLSLGFIDTFRYFNPESGQYSWWSYRANSRRKNLGWRIDYNLISITMKNQLKNASMLNGVVHSDHCPVVLELK
jgi:exodeoxyribonuclease-3